jgi:hypothetical protein
MPDQGLDASEYLAELEDQRAKLDIQIAGLRERLGLGPPDGNGGGPTLRGSATGTVRDPTVTGRIRSDEFFRMSIPEAIKRYLEIMKQPQPPTAIATGLKAGGILTESKNFYTTVWTAIKRLRAAGEIVSTQRGAWALSEWYPNRPKAGGDERKGKKGKRHGKASQKARKAPRATKKGSGASKRQTSKYSAFVGQQMKAGKTMRQAIEAWREQKGES